MIDAASPRVSFYHFLYFLMVRIAARGARQVWQVAATLGTLQHWWMRKIQALATQALGLVRLNSKRARTVTVGHLPYLSVSLKCDSCVHKCKFVLSGVQEKYKFLLPKV